MGEGEFKNRNEEVEPEAVAGRPDFGSDLKVLGKLPRRVSCVGTSLR